MNSVYSFENLEIRVLAHHSVYADKLCNKAMLPVPASLLHSSRFELLWSAGMEGNNAGYNLANGFEAAYKRNKQASEFLTYLASKL